MTFILLKKGTAIFKREINARDFVPAGFAALLNYFVFMYVQYSNGLHRCYATSHVNLIHEFDQCLLSKHHQDISNIRFLHKENVFHINRSLKSNWKNWICLLYVWEAVAVSETKYVCIQMIPLNGISHDILLPFILSSHVHAANEWQERNCFLHSANNLLLLLLHIDANKMLQLWNYSDCLTGVIYGMCPLRHFCWNSATFYHHAIPNRNK